MSQEIKKKWFKKPTHLLVILMVLSLSANYLTINKTVAEEVGGPSESTKKFFGDKGKEAGMFEPEECKREQRQQPNQNADEQSMRQQGDDLSRQIKQKEDALHNATSNEERSKLQGELDALMARAKEMETQSGGQGQRGPDNQGQHQEGPSTECKAAIVKMGKERMGTFASTITNNILPKLNKVAEIVSKLEAKLPDLKSAGISTETISKLENNIASIKTNSATMKSFFDEMIATLNAFISLADSDSEAAFKKMETMHKSGKNDSAATAADNLVKAFTELEEIMKSLEAEGGQNGNQ